MFLPVSVCLFVCPLDYSKSYEQILVNFLEGWDVAPKYIGSIGYCEYEIYIFVSSRDSLTILCQCHYNEGIEEFQVSRHKKG